MNKKRYIVFLLIIFLVGHLNVNASSGRLKNASIKTCNGITYGQHSSDNHWHVASRNSDGSYSATGNPIYSDPCASSSNSSSNNNSSDSSSNSNTSDSNNSTSSSNNTNNNNNNSISSSDNEDSENVTSQQIETKSSDNTLKAIIIDGTEIDISDNINYSTTKESINIEAITNDDKASYEIKNNNVLSVGKNKVTIEVVAEDGSIKIYNLNINREKKISSEIGINVVINGEEVKFDNYKSTVYVPSSSKTITFDYTLKDKNAKVKMNEISELKAGDNTINIKVIAEDGTEQQYEIIIHKYTQVEDTISTIIVLGIFGGIGYGIYYVINKKKVK